MKVTSTLIKPPSLVSILEGKPNEALANHAKEISKESMEKLERLNDSMENPQNKEHILDMFA